MNNDSYQSLLDKSRNNYFLPYEIENFLSEEEVKYCIDIYNELPVSESASDNWVTRKDYLMHNEHDKRMQDLFYPKLQKFFPDQNLVVDGGNFSFWHRPSVNHTDGYHFFYYKVEDIVARNNVLGPVILIPLDTDTHLGTPNTVFFDQTFFGGNQTVFRRIEDSFGANVDNFTFKEFEYTDETQKLLSHIPKEDLYGFSVKKAISWKYGNALVWHRAQFHSSSKFVEFNSKLHILFFLCAKQEQN
jgi:hypothetical protein